MHSGEWRLGYQPSLQGVRAVAVLAVFAFHIGQMRGGWLGVEVFFVLSGFLITLLLLSDADADAGDWSVRRFYVRRVARLLPAVLVVVAGTLVAGRLAGVTVSDFGALASLFYFANWAETATAPMAGFTHMWSLSIEEQFYFLWPLALLALMRRLGSVGVAIGAGVAFAFSVAARIAFAGTDDWYRHVYYGSDTRAAGLLVGCFAGALLFRSRGRLSQRVPTWVAPAAGGLILAAMVTLSNQVPSTWFVWVTLINMATALMLVALVNSEGWMAKLLSMRPTVYIGKISYGLYLWHVPVIYLATRALEGPERYAVQLTVPFLLAAASYKFLEVPAQRAINRRWGGRPHAPQAESTHEAQRSRPGAQ